MRQLNFLDELIIDNFAGGGGASCGIELATGYLEKVLKLLAPERTIDIPNFKRIFAAAFNDDVNLCDYCNEFQCNNCIVSKWKEECQR